MVLQKRLDYGFNGYEVPPTPRAARSPRKSAFKKKSENNQISSFDLLAAVAGKLLLEGGGNSSSSSNNASGDNEDQCAVKKEPLYGADQTVGEETDCDHHDNDPERRFFVSEILQKSHDMETFNRSPSPPKDFHFGSTSGITSDSSEKFGTQELEETKIDIGFSYRPAETSGSGFRKPIPPNPSVCSDDVNLLGRENDDAENFSDRYTTKSFRPTLRVGDRRIRKVLASKFCKVSSKQKDTTVTNSDLDLKPGYYSKKHCLKSLRSERNYPIKKRRYFDGYTASQSQETVKNEGLSSSPPKASAFLSSIDRQKQPAFQSRDSHVKLGIKSFRVPELFIEIPETATVGSLKRTVLEAVTTILGGGLRIGVLVHGKKVRDDNKMLLQTGISLDSTLSDTLGFCLEPNPPQISNKSLSPEDSNFVRPCNVPHTLTRCLPSLGKHAKPSNSVESDLESKPSAPNRAKTVYSRALIPVSPLHVQALSVVPPRKPKRCEVAQRRIRRPFSVAEVEALVQAVERLGTGRWRDVKLRAFDNAKHRTYVDLKDKWKTLVHTARISPQQRRGEPVPQELLDRVLTAHAYWSQQQGKQQLLEGEGPQKLETSLGL
ncbi:telomere repeat-binding protein 5 isoform X2 [Eutrema salsugineum]|uniref:telomere repeat-binding protein 5 isoform X2 n=1 Tax=Eutrema salsugineum TaxID=72664 RepID=UPI000CED5A0B|nr:telomere repeat-binding protein 5 isoform X2 [Eutrema salsugineum]